MSKRDLLIWVKPGALARRRHAGFSMMRRIHTCHTRRRIHTCHMRRRIHRGVDRLVLYLTLVLSFSTPRGRHVCIFLLLWHVCILLRSLLFNSLMLWSSTIGFIHSLEVVIGGGGCTHVIWGGYIHALKWHYRIHSFSWGYIHEGGMYVSSSSYDMYVSSSYGMYALSDSFILLRLLPQ